MFVYKLFMLLNRFTSQKASITLLLFLLFIIMACIKDKAKQPVEKSLDFCDSLYVVKDITYSSTIQRIVNLNCALANCHDSESVMGDVQLVDYEKVTEEINDGNFLCTIKWDEDCLPMPQDDQQLDQATIDTIDCWIEKNMPKN